MFIQSGPRLASTSWAPIHGPFVRHQETIRGQSAMSAKIRMSRFTCFIVFLSAIVCPAITSRTSNVAASGDEQQIRNARKFSRSWQASPAGKTIDQTGKNIQVLKGLPESQLYLVMNFVATSLGVQCNFCHVQQGKDPTTGSTKWVWESDDKPQKQTARRMMQMVLAIKANDKVDFRENEVTCYTCHRGQKKPIGLPPMPLARSGHEPGPDDVALPASTSEAVGEHESGRNTKSWCARSLRRRERDGRQN
jgi:Photosynthetic reaction centre cytochrome C subunit